MANVKNFTYSTVAVAPSPATSGTSLTVSSGDGALFVIGRPAVIYPTGLPPLSTNAEIVTVTNIVGDVLTITREQESTTARTVVVGDQIAQMLTAAEFNALETSLAGKEPTQTAASQAEMEAGTESAIRSMSPLRVAQAIAALAGSGGIPVETATHAATSKTTPVDADEMPIVDSAASWGLKKLTWANLKATLKTYLDTIYSAAGHNHSGVYDPAGTASAAMSSHTGAPDPHSQYALESALGTAATHNVPATGNAASGEVVKGSDTRLSDSRPPTAHAASHTNGTDDIQDATAAQKGLATAAQITKLDGIEAAADVTDAGNVGAAIHGATAKTTPVDADTVPLIDSAASNVLKKSTWANIKATLKTYFDSIYQAAGSYAAASHTHAQSDITNLTTDLAGKQAASSALSSAQAQGTASIRAIGTTTPAALGTAAAGSSTEASAKDHVHALPASVPVSTYLNFGIF